MPYKITDAKSGQVKGTTYTDKDVGRMVKRTSAIPGSVLRKTTGLDKTIKMRGFNPSKRARAALGAAVKAGSSGFSVMGKGRGGRSGT